MHTKTEEQLVKKITPAFRKAKEENFETPLHVKVTNADGVVVIEMIAYDKGEGGFQLVEKMSPRMNLLELPVTVLLSDIARTKVIKLKITRDEGWMQ